MTNHVHLLVTPLVEHGISSMMKTLGCRYVHYINKHYRRSGTLWEGRFKASPVDSDQYLLTCIRYIELNPVRARMVGHPGEYTWSSYHANAQCKNDPLIEPHNLYLSLGESEESRRSAYRELFRHYIDNDALHDIRSALNQELVPGRSYFSTAPQSHRKQAIIPLRLS
jgi:putative transposase